MLEGQLVPTTACQMVGQAPSVEWIVGNGKEEIVDMTAKSERVRRDDSNRKREEESEKGTASNNKEETVIEEGMVSYIKEETMADLHAIKALRGQGARMLEEETTWNSKEEMVGDLREKQEVKLAELNSKK